VNTGLWLSCTVNPSLGPYPRLSWKFNTKNNYIVLYSCCGKSWTGRISASCVIIIYMLRFPAHCCNRLNRYTTIHIYAFKHVIICLHTPTSLHRHVLLSNVCRCQLRGRAFEYYRTYALRVGRPRQTPLCGTYTRRYRRHSARSM